MPIDIWFIYLQCKWLKQAKQYHRHGQKIAHEKWEPGLGPQYQLKLKYRSTIIEKLLILSSFPNQSVFLIGT